MPIHGVPLVKPAFALPSHCTGVRESSRERSRTMWNASSGVAPSSCRIL